MNRSDLSHVLVIGAGAAGLMAGRELARAGKRVTILEARDRNGGRICPLPAADFGYAADGGPEFIHGEAPVTRTLIREAGLTTVPRGGARWRVRDGIFTQRVDPPHEDQMHQALIDLTADLPVAEFLATRFAGADYAELRHSILRMVEGYDAADPRRASTLALRDEWMDNGLDLPGRIAEGYGALIAFLAAECRRHGAAIHHGAVVSDVEAGRGHGEAGRHGETGRGQVTVRCRDGTAVVGDTAILSVPLPLLSTIALPPVLRERVAKAAGDIGFGNVVKILLRFKTSWWADQIVLDGRSLADLAFLMSEARVPTWWTQQPIDVPVLTGWFAGPRADTVMGRTEDELVDMGLASLAEIFARPVDRLRADLVVARALNWGADPFARGAYSYATPKTIAAQAALREPVNGVFAAGEALHVGKDRGTVEAGLANGKETAGRVLGSGR